MMTKKILIVDSVHPYLSEQLQISGFECVTNKTLSYQDFLDLSDEWCGLIIRSRFVVDRPLLASKPHLKFVMRIGSGVENIDTDACRELGIACLSTPEGNAHAVAEHCLALMFAALKNVAKADKEVRAGVWERVANKGGELCAQKVGIIGYGHNGRELAKMLHLLGCQVMAYDKFKSGFSDEYAQETDLDTLLQMADIVSLNINYLPENHYFINKEKLEKMSRKPIFVNTSRGLSVNTADLLAALQAGRIRYACLDVLEYESVRLQIGGRETWTAEMLALAERDDVVLTPHIAGQTFQADLRHAETALQKILDLKL